MVLWLLQLAACVDAHTSFTSHIILKTYFISVNTGFGKQSSIGNYWEEKVKNARFDKEDDRFAQSDLVAGQAKNIHVGNFTYLLLITLCHLRDSIKAIRTLRGVSHRQS